AGNPAAAEEMIRALRPDFLSGTEDQQSESLAHIVDHRELVFRGEELRMRSQKMEHVIADDLHLLVDHGNKDVKAYRPGRCPYLCDKLFWFRCVPDDTLLPPAAEIARVGSELRIHYKGAAADQGSWFSVDPNHA